MQRSNAFVCVALLACACACAASGRHAETAKSAPASAATEPVSLELDPCLASERATPGQQTRTTGQLDPVFLRLAQATGGKVLDLRNIPQGANAIRAGLSGRGQQIQQLGHVRKVAASREGIPLLVDPATTRVSLLVCGPPGMQATLRDSAGRTLIPSAARAGRAEFDVMSPAAGVWNVQIAGATGQVVQTDAQATTLFAADFKLDEQLGRAGHTGWFPVKDQPLVGRSYRVQVELELDGKAARDLKDVRLGLVQGSAAPRWLDTNAMPRPVAAFEALASFSDGDRLLVGGHLADGAAFVRESVAIVPSALRLSPVEPRANEVEPSRALVPTRWSPLAVRVERASGNGPVFLWSDPALASTNALELRIEPQQLQLAAGQSQILSVFVRAKLGAAAKVPEPGREASALLRAGRSRSDPNAARLAIHALVDDDSDGDGSGDGQERARGVDFDGNADGVADYLQKHVTSFPVLLGMFTLALPEGAMSSEFEPLTILGRDMPAGYFAPYGGFRLRVEQTGSAAPERLQLFVGRVVHAMEKLVVFDPVQNAWRPRADFDAQRGLFTLELTQAERALLTSRGLSIAPSAR